MTGPLVSAILGIRRARIVLVLLLTATTVQAGFACDRHDAAGGPTTSPATRPAGKTVASLVPAATDLLLGMGAGDRLVAVSNYDVPRPGVRGLPRVGDYQTTDWEQVRALRPAVMIRQFAPDRIPAGLKERTDALGIRLVNLQIETVNDVYRAAEVLGDAIDEPAAGKALADGLRGELDAVRAQTTGGSRPSVLLVRDARGEEVIGPDNFLDDLVTIAGGRNAAAGLGKRYPSIDRELLRSLDPDVIIQLLPDATPQVLEQARRTWEGLPSLKAVKAGRVSTLTDWYGLLPGAHLGDLAEKFAAAIHPEAAPATRPVGLRVGGIDIPVRDVRSSGGAFLQSGGIDIPVCDVRRSGGAFLPLPRPHMICQRETDKNACPTQNTDRNVCVTTGKNACATAIVFPARHGDRQECLSHHRQECLCHQDIASAETGRRASDSVPLFEAPSFLFPATTP